MFTVVSVKVHQSTFAFRLDDVREVLLLPRLLPHLEQPSILEGWFQLRGQPIPVVSLARVLKLADQVPRLTDQLVLSKSEPAIAWRVQGINGILSFEGQDLEMVRSDTDAPRVFLAQYRKDGEVVFLLNTGELLSREDLESLRTLQRSVSFG